jgi:hypothetical protein
VGFTISEIVPGGQADAFGFVVGDCLVGIGGVDFAPHASIEDVLPRLAERPLTLKIKAAQCC